MEATTRAAWKVPAAVGAGALILGIVIGAVGSSDPAPEAPPAAKSSTGQTAADLDAREASLEKQAAEQAQKESAIQDEVAALDEREADVSALEDEAESNTIEGDGNFEVGVDIEPGTWKNADRGTSCYWSINSDANGDDILQNANGGGPQTLILKKGQYLELANDCGTWTRRK